MFEEKAEEYYYKTYPVTLNIGEEERKKEVTDIFTKGAECGYNSAIEWFDAKESIPLPKQLGIYRYTIEAISDKGDIVCYDYKDKNWKKLVIEDEKVTYVPVEIEMWCNKPTKEIK